MLIFHLLKNVEIKLQLAWNCLAWRKKCHITKGTRNNITSTQARSVTPVPILGPFPLQMVSYFLTLYLVHVVEIKTNSSFVDIHEDWSQEQNPSWVSHTGFTWQNVHSIKLFPMECSGNTLKACKSNQSATWFPSYFIWLGLSSF